MASNVGSVSDTAIRMTVPEAARRLGLPGDEVYTLIFRGALDGRLDMEGAVSVSAASVEEYLARHRADATDS